MITGMKKAGIRWGLLIAAMVAISGCGKSNSKVTVSGKVTYKGNSLPSVMLAFTGPNGAYSVAQVQTDGSFIMTDVVPGEHKVSVMASPDAAGTSNPNSPAQKTQAKLVNLPAKYYDPAKSGLSCSITGASQDLEIKIN